MFLRFLIVGGTGYILDAGVTYILIHISFEPWLARIPAILIAMLFTWFANRYFTYRVKYKHSATEMLKYALVAIIMALANYLIYLVLVNVGTQPIIAVTIGTACQTFISYYAYRYFVFGVRS